MKRLAALKDENRYKWSYLVQGSLWYYTAEIDQLNSESMDKVIVRNPKFAGAVRSVEFLDMRGRPHVWAITTFLNHYSPNAESI